MKPIIDNFSTHGADYASFRPDSPQGIYDFLYAHVSRFDTAWNCGTGNGQIAAKLSEKFTRVYGTDISKDQLANAIQKDNITYCCERAEATSIPGGSVDLITVGQAIHWFDFDSFYKEARRVARPGALLAAWTYNLLRMTPAINAVLDHLYLNITHAYWDKERDYVDAAYATIPFPFDELKTPELSIIKQYTLPQLIGYLGTWSGVRHYKEKEHKDPVSMVKKELAEAWGPEETHEVYWPVYVRAARL